MSITRTLSLLGTLTMVGVASSFTACAVQHDVTSDDEQIEGTHPSSAPIIGGTKASAYPEAALVDMYQSGSLYAYCSGSVIAPQVVLTAGHCVDGTTGWDVTVPYASGQKVHSTSGATYDWAEHGSETVNPNHHDIGLIFLPTPITLPSYPTLATAAQANGAKINNIGRINNGTLSTKDLFIGPATTITSGTSSGYPFDYSSSDVIQSGDSGGPDVLAGSSPHLIVSVNSGAGGSTQVLARVDLLSTWIAQQIAAHGGSGSSTGGGSTGGGSTGGGSTGGGSTGGGSTGGGSTGGGSTGGTCSAEKEPNDTYTAPEAMAACLNGNLSTTTDQDWYSFSVSGSGVAYDVKLTTTGDAALEMWKLQGGQYYSVATTSTNEIARTSSGAGSYVLVVYSPSGTSQKYQLTKK